MKETLAPVGCNELFDRPWLERAAHIMLLFFASLQHRFVFMRSGRTLGITRREGLRAASKLSDDMRAIAGRVHAVVRRRPAAYALHLSL
jgi:hypothetical protein